MKVKNIDKFNPITITIENPRIYLAASVIADSPFFLQEIDDLRSYFKLDQIFKYGDYSAWSKHLFSLADFDENISEDMQEIQSDRLKELKSEFNERISNIRQTFNYPPRFDEFIKEAVFFYEVRDGNILPAYPSVLGINDKFGWKKDSEINIIVFEPYANEDDIIAAFKQWKNLTNDEKARLKFDKELYSDSASNTQRDRNWYWQKYKYNMTYDEILDDWNNQCPKNKIHKENEKCIYCDLFDKNVIEQAVSTYRKRIQLLFPLKS